MPKIDIEVFVQNIKDCTTILQQLQVCIKQIEEIINIINKEEDNNA